MTEEFKKKMSKILEEKYIIARREDTKVIEINQKYADLYMELVLAVVEQFDFHNPSFRNDKVNKDVLKKFGQPRKISSWLSPDTSTATIALDYQDEKNGLIRAGEPEFKKDPNFNLNIINKLLEKNDIRIHEDHIDGGGIGSHNDYIYFDASMLLEKAHEFSEDRARQYKRGCRSE